MDTTEEVLCFEASAEFSNGGGDDDGHEDEDETMPEEGGGGGDTAEKEGEQNGLQESATAAETAGGGATQPEAGEEEGVIVLDSDEEEEKKPVLAELEAKLKKKKEEEKKLEAAAAAAAEPEDSGVPEDMADMTVVDEADCSDVDSDLDENGESRQWECSLARKAPRTYREKDFRPTEKDPRCKEDWPLAAFWPVYVSNFRLFHRFDSDTNCLHAVHKYFAAKGLPSFMVFRWKDNFFSEYQKRVGLYDFLVYFCTEKDANRAIQWCNRESYYGHKLNVYNGRTPDLFAKPKSWRLKHLKAEDKLETETNLEQYLRRYGEVRCVSKVDLDGVFVEFDKTFEDFESLFAEDRRIEATQVEGPVSRQRFVERDVEEEIQKALEAKPKLIKTRPRNFLLRSLKHGVIPEMWNLWHKTEAEALIEFKNKRREGAAGRATAGAGLPVSRRGNPLPPGANANKPGPKGAARAQKFRDNKAAGNAGGGGGARKDHLPPRPARRDRSPFRSPARQRRERSRSNQRTRPLDDIDKIIRLKQELADLYARQLDGVPAPARPRDGGSGMGGGRNRPQPYQWNKTRDNDDLLGGEIGRRADRRPPPPRRQQPYNNRPQGGPQAGNNANNSNSSNNSAKPAGGGVGGAGAGAGAPFPRRQRIRGRKRPRGAGTVGGGAAGSRPNP